MLTFLSDLTPASAIALGLVPVGLIGVTLAFAQANAAYFDPRRADESARTIPVLLVVGPALYDARRACLRLTLHAAQIRDRARLALVAALLRVLAHLDTTSSAPEKGANR
ncbi:hypothetical protein OHB14_36420 [Streptomyces sp. NBC_01613]|uniref:hypothetical protein n=1 Tax=Streptomyces sp. NBC_01613 TaxID=2975896 RepID=UPI0038687FC3